MRKLQIILFAVIALPALKAQSQVSEPLKLIQTNPIPGLHDGDFDHFAASVPDHLLFLAAEENGAVEVFDLNTNKLIHTISDLNLANQDKKLFAAFALMVRLPHV